MAKGLARRKAGRRFVRTKFSTDIYEMTLLQGFRKVVPDRWEFANENFRRGEQRLLSGIRRRKAAPPPQASAGKPSGTQRPPSSYSNSGEAQSSSSTSSPPLPPPPLPPSSLRHLLELTNENEKLKKDNQTLNTELTQAKRHCEELLGFLSKFVDVGKLDIDLLMQQEAGGVGLGVSGIEGENGEEAAAGGEEDQGERDKGLKLFGVFLKGLEDREEKKGGRVKRARCEEGAEGCGVAERPMKMMGFRVPWMEMVSSVQRGSSKVCH